MKKIVMMFAVVAFAGSAFAAEVIDFKASYGDVQFPHKMHQGMLKDCKKCHENGPGKIAGFGKEWAHKTCKGCHNDMKRGPQGCKDCHHKS